MTVNAEQLHFILDNTPAQQNIMLMGKHGIGKSRILEDYFSKKGAKVVTLFLGQMSDPGDLIGLPEKNEKTGKTDFMLPYWFPTDGSPIVLFLDELNRARPEVLQTIMDLTLNRKLAGKSLPEGSRIISAVNNGFEYQLTDLDPALVSRFNIYEFSPTVNDWLNWGKENAIDQRILSFIDENPEYLDADESFSDGDNLSKTPDRRSWERVSSIIKNFTQLTFDVLYLISGIIGSKAASVFFKYVNQHNVPGAKEILTSDFQEVKKSLLELSISDFTFVNDSLLKFIEHEICGNSNADNSDAKKAAQNLNLYFDFLVASNRKELSSHFISLCKADDYPKALVFITENCGELYTKIISSLGE